MFAQPQSLGLIEPKLLATAALLPAFVIYWLLWCIYSHFFHPLAKYPGPFLASVSRVWIAYRVIRGDMDKVQRDLHRRYGIYYLVFILLPVVPLWHTTLVNLRRTTLGSIIRIAPNEVSISAPDAIKTIYGVSSHFTKVSKEKKKFTQSTIINILS